MTGRGGSRAGWGGGGGYLIGEALYRGDGGQVGVGSGAGGGGGVLNRGSSLSGRWGDR